jgi:5-methylcytosine-specific restriction protein A
MPWAAPTVCRHVGCRTLVSSPGMCKLHKSQANREYNRQRAGLNVQTDKWYHTARWQKLRASILAAEPLCRMCVAEDRVTMAELVDHIKPVKFEGEFWDRGNLQPLCTKCHEVKSYAEGSRMPRYAMRKAAAPVEPLERVSTGADAAPASPARDAGSPHTLGGASTTPGRGGR